MVTSSSSSPFIILLTSWRVFPGTTAETSELSPLRFTFLIDILCPSRETTERTLSFTSKSSPLISFEFSLSETEKIVCLITSLRPILEITTDFSLLTARSSGKSSPDQQGISNLDFSHIIVVL